MNIQIQKRENKNEKLRKASSSEAVYNLQEVQEIKNAIQEHMLYIGLDRNNHVRHVNLLSIGNNAFVTIDKKNLIRTALVNADDRVVLVHNHPSNSLIASKEDIKFSNVINRLLEVFDVELLDHIIVSEDGYMSMMKEENIDMEYSNHNIDFLNQVLVYDENSKLKAENELLLKKIKDMKNIESELEVEEEI